MDLNWFTLLSSACLLVPIGLAVWSAAWTGAAATRVWSRILLPLIIAACAFAIFAPAIIHSDPDTLARVNHQYLLLRNFDNAALHHTILFAIAASIVVASIRQPASLIAPLIALGLVAVVAIGMKTVWYTMFRNGGMIAVTRESGVEIPGVLDIAGAMVLVLPATMMAAVAQRMIRVDPTSSISPPQRARLRVLAAAIVLFGWIALVASASVMQSPATVTNAAMNVLRAATGGAVIGAISAKLRRAPAPAGEVAASMLVALVAITSAAGRAPGLAAVAIGSAAAVVLPAFAGLVRGLGIADPTRLIGIGFCGGVVAVIAAAPFGVSPEPLGLQIVLQLLVAMFFLALSLCVSVLYCILARAVQNAFAKERP